MKKIELIDMKVRKQQESQEYEMDEIEQMLRLIYVNVWGEGQYDMVLRKYKQIEGQSSDSWFSVEGKLLEDIVQGINQLKEENVRLRQSSVTGNNKNQNRTTINNTNHIRYQHEHDFTKKPTLSDNNSNNRPDNGRSPPYSEDHYAKQLKLRQTKIHRLQNKIKKLQDKIERVQSELKEYKQESVNLHRLNESKYSKISELKRQLSQQQSLIQEQVTVIQQLQKTLNETMIMENQSSRWGNQGKKDVGQRVLKELQQQQKYKQEQRQQGKRQAWKEMISQIQLEIQKLTLNQRNQQQQKYINNNNSKLLTKTRLNKQIPSQFELSNINIKMINNHHFNNRKSSNIQPDDEIQQLDDGIQQLQLSFNHIEANQPLQINNILNISTSVNPIAINNHGYHRQQGYQISQIYRNNQLQLSTEQPSQINHLLNNGNNYLQQQSLEEYSFLSNNPNRYLQTIQTMTQQLTQAYQQINQLQSQLIFSSQSSPQYNSISTQQLSPVINTLNPQLLSSQSVHQINSKVTKDKKSKPFNFNLSFWK